MGKERITLTNSIIKKINSKVGNLEKIKKFELSIVKNEMYNLNLDLKGSILNLVGGSSKFGKGKFKDNDIFDNINLVLKFTSKRQDTGYTVKYYFTVIMSNRSFINVKDTFIIEIGEGSDYSIKTWFSVRSRYSYRRVYYFLQEKQFDLARWGGSELVLNNLEIVKALKKI